MGAHESSSQLRLRHESHRFNAYITPSSNIDDRMKRAVRQFCYNDYFESLEFAWWMTPRARSSVHRCPPPVPRIQSGSGWHCYVYVCICVMDAMQLWQWDQCNMFCRISVCEWMLWYPVRIICHSDTRTGRWHLWMNGTMDKWYKNETNDCHDPWLRVYKGQRRVGTDEAGVALQRFNSRTHLSGNQGWKHRTGII